MLTATNGIHLYATLTVILEWDEWQGLQEALCSTLNAGREAFQLLSQKHTGKRSTAQSVEPAAHGKGLGRIDAELQGYIAVLQGHTALGVPRHICGSIPLAESGYGKRQIFAT